MSSQAHEVGKSIDDGWVIVHLSRGGFHFFLEKLSLDWKAYIKGLPCELQCQAPLAIGGMWG